jgi:hypothetical protein
MPDENHRQPNLAWAYCPRCKAAIGQLDAKCPGCGYDFPSPPSPPDPDAITYQFDIRFLFYLMVLTAAVCSACSMLGHTAWILALPMFISGILIWRTRRVHYAVFPGLSIGFLIGSALTQSNDPLSKIEGGVFVACVFGCPLNAWFKGFPKSGCLAIVLGIVSMVLARLLI